MALLWAAGIIYFALQVATPDAPAAAKKGEQAQTTDITGAPVKDEDMKKLEKAINGL
jgi:hypothetical protein